MRVDLDPDGTTTLAYTGMHLDEELENAYVSWNLDAEVNNPNELNTTITPSEDGIFQYHVSVTNGLCSDYDSIRIQVITPFSAPNAITPNGDGINETWKIYGLRGREANVRVYNRWGSLIFERFTNYYDQFDGKYKGKRLPIGTYYWTIEFPANDIENASGTVTILY